MGHSAQRSFPVSPEGGREDTAETLLPPFLKGKKKKNYFLKSKAKVSCNLKLLTFKHTDLQVLLGDTVRRDVT